MGLLPKEAHQYRRNFQLPQVDFSGCIQAMPLKSGWWLVVVLISISISRGQSPLRNDTSQGYWQVQTSPSSRSTTIQFYSADETLVYEEHLPEKWVKLTRKNQIKLDKLLEQILENQLLISRLRIQNLPPPPPDRSRVQTRTDAPETGNIVGTMHTVNAFVSREGKLHVTVTNPEQSRFVIQIQDDRGLTVYQEFNNREEYRRRFDISALQFSTLQVVVEVDKQKHTYQIKRHDTKTLYSMEPEIAINM